MIRIRGLEVAHALPEHQAPKIPPLVLVHGTATDCHIWRNWLAAVPNRGWEAYSISLRGHGQSAAPDEKTYCQDLRVEDYVDDVASVLAELGRPCVVVGHSMGGIIGQRLVARGGAGVEVSALVLLTSVWPGQLGPYTTELIPTEKPFYYTAASTVSESPSVINDFLSGPGIPIDPDRITCPILVVSAELDTATVPKDDCIARFFGADYHLATGIGHEILLDPGWDAVLDHTLGWLEAAH